jgi:NADPH-dependent 2,4-dienoyl-CoA reductase/sulfur reductase-like enzyme
VIGTAVVKVCDLEVGRTGLSTQEAGMTGFSPLTATISHKSRAGYYPGSQSITARLMFDRSTGRVLGGQLLGREGVAKRVDVIAAAVHAGVSVEELSGYDLSYAPPFAPAWDPVLLVARKAVEALSG